MTTGRIDQITTFHEEKHYSYASFMLSGVRQTSSFASRVICSGRNGYSHDDPMKLPDTDLTHFK